VIRIYSACTVQKYFEPHLASALKKTRIRPGSSRAACYRCLYSQLASNRPKLGQDGVAQRADGAVPATTVSRTYPWEKSCVTSTRTEVLLRRSPAVRLRDWPMRPPFVASLHPKFHDKRDHTSDLSASLQVLLMGKAPPRCLDQSLTFPASWCRREGNATWIGSSIPKGIRALPARVYTSL